MDKKILIGCELLLVQNDQILLGNRKNCYGAGTWGLPGGHLEHGEKMIDAARRELAEETGITESLLEIAAVVDDPRPDQHYIHIAFKVNQFSGKLKNMEPDRCEEWKFFPLSELPKNIFPPYRNILKTFLNKTVYLP